MHKSALLAGEAFFSVYCGSGKVLDIGAMDVNGSMRRVAPASVEYVGADISRGTGVDVVLSDPYALPFAQEFDAVISTSCLEHAPFFWLTFLECLRVLKIGGLLYINVPSNGPYHPYPNDSWRFYPDSGLALEAWGRRQGCQVSLVESFVLNQIEDVWNDYIAVFQIGEVAQRPSWMHTKFPGATNIQLIGRRSLIRESRRPEDQRKSTAWRRVLGLR